MNRFELEPSYMSVRQDGYGNTEIKDFRLGNPFCFADILQDFVDQAKLMGCQQIYYQGCLSLDELRIFQLCGFEAESLPPEDLNVWVVWRNLR